MKTVLQAESLRATDDSDCRIKFKSRDKSDGAADLLVQFIQYSVPVRTQDQYQQPDSQ